MNIPASVACTDEAEDIREVIDWLLPEPHHLNLMASILQDP